MASPSRSAAITIVAVLCFTYVLSMFYRAANAVIGPDLMREVGIGAADLGFLTGIFFIVFAACQMPVGVLLDRYGPRRSMAALLLFAVLGAGVFASADGLLGLTTGRALLGIGSSALLIGPLVIFARWFPPNRFSTMTAVLVSFGTAGSLLATAPLGLAAATIGWRGAFAAMAAFTAFGALLVWWLVRDAPPGHPYHQRRPETMRETMAGVVEVLKNRRMPLVFCMNFTTYATVITILGLWGGPYLYDVHGLDAVRRGNVLLAMAIASLAGYMTFGPLDRVFDTRKWLIIPSATGIVTANALLATLPQPAVWQVTVLFSAIGFLNGSLVFILAHGRSIFPDRLVGRGMTVLNMGTMGGAAIIQLLSGWLISLFPPTPEGGVPEVAYRCTFALLAALLGIAILIYSRIDDAKPSHEQRPV